MDPSASFGVVPAGGQDVVNILDLTVQLDGLRSGPMRTVNVDTLDMQVVNSVSGMCATVAGGFTTANA